LGVCPAEVKVNGEKCGKEYGGSTEKLRTNSVQQC